MTPRKNNTTEQSDTQPDSQSVPNRQGQPESSHRSETETTRDTLDVFSTTELQYDQLVTDQSQQLPELLYCNNYYELLGISEGASQSQVSKQAEQMIVEYHPDNTDFDDPLASDIFIIVTEAREILTTPSRREAYDTLGHDTYITESADIGTYLTDATPYTNNTHTNTIPAKSQDQTTGDSQQPTGTVVEPGSADEQPETGAGYSPGMGSRTAQGQAVLNGESLVTGDIDSLTTRAGQHSEQDDEQDTFSLFDRGQPDIRSRSSIYLLNVWKDAWKGRLLAAATGAGLFVAATLGLGTEGLPGFAPLIGDSLLGAAVTGFVLFGLLSSVYLSAWYEWRLPRGYFLRDGDHGDGRTSAKKAVLKGIGTGAVAIALGATAAVMDATPWTHADRSLRAVESPPTASTESAQVASPWLPESLPVGAAGEFPDVMLSALFLLLVVTSLFFLGGGITYVVWHNRYVNGLRTRPFIPESILVSTVLSGLVCATLFQHRTTTLLQVQIPDAVPGAMVRVCAASGGEITAITVFALSYGLLILYTIAYWVRVAGEQTIKRFTDTA